MYQYGKTQLHPKLLSSFLVRFRSNEQLLLKKSAVHADVMGGPEKITLQLFVFFVALLLVGVLTYEQFMCCCVWAVGRSRCISERCFWGGAVRLCHNTAA